MQTKAIIYEGVFTQSLQPVQQLSNLWLGGLSTAKAYSNTFDGMLFCTYLKTGSTYTLSAYQDPARSQLVASAAGALGVNTLTAQNGSNLTGSINFVQYEGDDSKIIVRALLSDDRDLQMANMETLGDYDPIQGFAQYHQEAFNYIVHEYLTSKYQSDLWSDSYVDTDQVLSTNTGGYQLARLSNLSSFREASAQYAFARICERQNTDRSGTFGQRYEMARARFRELIGSLDVAIDANLDRVEEKRRVTNTFRISR